MAMFEVRECFDVCELLRTAANATRPVVKTWKFRTSHAKAGLGRG